MKTSRRHVVAGLAAGGLSYRVGFTPRSATAQDRSDPLRFGYPIGWPERPPAAGFFIRHGFTSENTWYFPAHWHCGEDCTGSGAAHSDYERRHAGEDRRRLTARLTGAAGFEKGMNP